MSQKRIVYFIGAGLSKSLEKPGKQIPLMYDFVSVMAEYVQDDRIILATLAQLENGGFFAWPSPQASDLARRILGRVDPARQTVVRFRDAMKRRPAESIEDLLLKASSLSTSQEPTTAHAPFEEVMRRSAPTNAPDQFRYAISRLFGHWIGWEVDWCPLEAFLSHQFASHPLGDCKHTFISFNYDLLLDRAVHGIARDTHGLGGAVWHPSTGYGFEISWYLPEPNILSAPNVSHGSVSGGAAERNEAHQLLAAPISNILVLKPHGSLNWIICHNDDRKSGEAGLLVNPSTPVFIPLADGTSLDYWHAEKQECANIYYKPQSGADFAKAHASIFLVPPTPAAKKTSPAFITKVRNVQKAAIREADDIFVVGWSMPLSDQDQICSIRSCIAQRDKPLESVTVINRGERPEYFARIADTFGIGRTELRVFNNGFSDFMHHAAGRTP